jgi:hypothetical protein
MSVCRSAWNNSAPTGRIFMKFDVWVCFENLSRKLKFHSNLTRQMCTLHEDLRISMTVSRWILLRMRNFSDKVVAKMKTHILCSITFLLKFCRLWDNVEKYGKARNATDYNIIRRMRFSCWITKATNTHSDYVTLIAFPRQQWFRERGPILRYTYIASLIYTLLSHSRNLPTKYHH